MHRRSIFALVGAILILVLALSGSAVAAGGTAVTLRVEGKARTLLVPTVVKTHAGSITQGGTPRGKCPAASAAGALDVATHHRWGGSWNAKYGALLLTTIFGETHSLSTKYYWSVWVDHVYAQSGICGLKLHRGEQLLFAAVPDNPIEYPIALTAPRGATVGRSFKVKAVAFTSSGQSKALAGASVNGSGVSAVTGRGGTASITAHKSGTLVLQVSKNDYIRSAPITIRISS